MSKRLTPLQSIKKYCRYDCCANDLISWRECSVIKCPLYLYRLGKRPKKQAVIPIKSSENNQPNKVIE